MKGDKITKRSYKHLYLFPFQLEYEGTLMECSVRTDARNLEVEEYHDYFFETGEVANEGDPWAIGFGE